VEQHIKDSPNLAIIEGCCLRNEVFGVMPDNSMELLQQFNDSPFFQKWLVDMMFSLTYSKQEPV
jgi:type I restriction enzyme R subunit